MFNRNSNQGFSNPEGQSKGLVNDFVVAKNVDSQTMRFGTGGSIAFSSDATNIYLKDGATTLLTIVRATGAWTLGGSAKTITCSQIIGA